MCQGLVESVYYIENSTSNTDNEIGTKHSPLSEYT